MAAAIVLLIAASFIRSIVTNKNFYWHIVGQYLFDSRVLHGALVTIELGRHGLQGAATEQHTKGLGLEGKGLCHACSGVAPLGPVG